MSDSYVFCGLSTVSIHAAGKLHSLGMEVLGIDRNKDFIQKVSGSVTKAVCADLRDKEVLRSIGVLDCDVAVIGLRHNFDVAVILVHMFKKAGLKQIVAQVDCDDEEEAIRVVGATHVVFPERDAADRLVKTLTLPGLVERITLTEDAGVIEVACPKAFVGKSLIDLKIRAKYGVHVVGIRKASDPRASRASRTILAPDPETHFDEGDMILALGHGRQLTSFAAELSRMHERDKKQ
ncbi:potassium channel family protein [Acidobacteriota bacterium]